jgi:DNA primase
VIVAFDGDSAGSEATVRCLPALEEAGIDGRVVRFDETDDPDAFVRRRGAKALLDKMDDAQDLVVWALDQVLPRAERGDVQANVKALEEAGELLRAVESDVAREQYAREIARRLAIEPRLVSEYIKRPKSTGDRVERAVAAAQKPMKLPAAEFGVLVALLDHPEWLDGFLSESYDHLLASAELAEFLHTAANAQRDGRWEPAAMLDRLDPPAFRATVEEALLAADNLYQADRARPYYEDCIRSLQRQWADRALRDIEQQLEQVDYASQRDRWAELIEQQKEIQAFRRRLQNDAGARTQP